MELEVTYGLKQKVQLQNISCPHLEVASPLNESHVCTFSRSSRPR